MGHCSSNIHEISNLFVTIPDLPVLVKRVTYSHALSSSLVKSCKVNFVPTASWSQSYQYLPRLHHSFAVVLLRDRVLVQLASSYMNGRQSGSLFVLGMFGFEMGRLRWCGDVFYPYPLLPAMSGANQSDSWRSASLVQPWLAVRNILRITARSLYVCLSLESWNIRDYNKHTNA